MDLLSWDAKFHRLYIVKINGTFRMICSPLDIEWMELTPQISEILFIFDYYYYYYYKIILLIVKTL